ncbi:hypothetical protein Spa11_39120 [Botrimarina mediterranea]|uniref:Uncharacterized protein n=1 Tax=Botrimarina mediterranea TaxID=2528022 RepID=A0A518KD27_9BACT|nr:hypothetical protein Spa11_39120 [Botrimarina mediterranea]
MSSCNCIEFADLELLRKEISSRAKHTKQLISLLKHRCTDSSEEHWLLECESCSQYWQRSLAWNWGNIPYLFRVPPINDLEWADRPFVQPDELLIFLAVVGKFYREKCSVLGVSNCKIDDCDSPNVKFSTFCKRHHIEHLQANNLLPRFPIGRWFAPYEEANFRIPGLGEI